MKTVFYTVVSTLANFFAIHPGATVHIEGSSRQRLEVYKGLIYRHWKHIEPFYEVKGFINGKIEFFKPGQDFEYFFNFAQEVVNLTIHSVKGDENRGKG